MIAAKVASRYITRAWDIATSAQMYIDKLGTQHYIKLITDKYNDVCIENSFRIPSLPQLAKLRAHLLIHL